jgi:hypothetical protein
LIKKNFVSNFGYTFEENIMMIQKGDSVLEDNISRLVFNILCETKQLNEISVSNNWKILPKLSNQTELIKLDNLLKTKFERYNLVINNVNSDVALPINNENILSEEDFINTLSDVEILLFGEQHFISAQEQFLIKIYEKLLRIGFKTIRLEIPEKNQKNLDLFLEGKIEDLDKDICMMRDFIFKVRDIKKLSPEIKIYCVDVDTSTLRTKEDFLKREVKLSNHIDSVKHISNGKILGVFGNYHVQKTKKFYLFRNDESYTFTQILSQKYKCLSVNTFGFSGEEKLGPINYKIRYKFNNLYKNDILPKKIFQNETFLLNYPPATNQTIFLDSGTYTTITENENSPFDYSLIFKKQSVTSWSQLYEEK